MTDKATKIAQALANASGLPVALTPDQTVWPFTRNSWGSWSVSTGSVGSTGSNVVRTLDGQEIQLEGDYHPFRSSWPIARRTRCDECGIHAEDHWWPQSEETTMEEPETTQETIKDTVPELEEKIRLLAQQARQKLEEDQDER